ncbi:MAG: hypothetical protein ACE5HE_14875 [Phycisphaerae bacterium]
MLDWKDFELDIGPFEQAVLTVTVHKSSVACTSLDANSATALSTCWGWTDTNNNGLWSFDFYYRGIRVFSGPIVNFKKAVEAHDGTAYITLQAESFFQHFTRRRLVRTSTGTQWTATDEIADIYRTLCRENMDPDDIVTPTGAGNRQAYPATESRSDFGPNFTVEVAADDNTGTSITYKVDNFTNLHDALMELSTHTALDTDWLWPTITESPAGTFTIDVLHARSGGSRGIGSDLSSSIMFTTARRNLLRFAKEFDGSAATTLWTVTGKGIAGSGQYTRHIADGTLCDRVGVFEDMMNNPHAGTTDMLDREAQRLVNEASDGWVSWTADIVETTGNEFPADFNIRDTITIYDGAFGETVADMIIGARISIPTPGPAKLALKFGRIPRSTPRELGRSGGGMRGGRSGGGRPRSKSGDPETDPDDLVIYKTIAGDTGSADADTTTDTYTLTSDSGKGASEIHVLHTVTDDPEVGLLKVRADMDVGDLTPTHYFEIQDTGGTFWLVPVQAKSL